MPRNYTKVEQLAEDVFKRKADGETNRQIAQSYGLTLKQIRNLITRQNRKEKKLAAGEIVRPKGRPRKQPQTAEEEHAQEIRQLKMTVDLLRNFLLEAGRR